MKHSQTIVSDLLSNIHACQEEINSSLLIGEKVAMITETAQIYNRLKELIAPDYLLDAEWEWLQTTADGWNEDVRTYKLSHQGSDTTSHSVENLADFLNDMLDDIMDGFEPPQQDNGGFDGGDGIH